MTLSKRLLSSALLAAALIAAPASYAAAKEASGEELLEKHIAHLHNALKVSAAQEEQWKPVAQTMRDNETAIHSLIAQKQAMMATQSAVDDLNSYAEIVAAHAEASKKLATVFAGFYASLSDDQKKTADEFFREHKRRASHMAKH
jgi:hypothetical protein